MASIRDHPREYGENGLQLAAASMSKGSSPRIRGKWIHSKWTEMSNRIIPANTGKMCLWFLRAWWGRDHPREYGENYVGGAWCRGGEGSSPRIRGKCARDSRGAPQRGIIPANTGKMARDSMKTYSPRDHPREYGENVAQAGLRPGDPGSSPRIRGKCHGHAGHVQGTGIIPANTGKIVVEVFGV